jgi:hypothetical protein
MGNEYAWRKGLPRAAMHRRCWRISTFITRPIFWAQAWRRKQAHGDVIVMRYADDIVVGFQSETDAKQFLAELTERFRKFSLELHPDKTRLLEFGRFAARNLSPYCEATSEERSVANPHATFCGSRRWATASGHPVGQLERAVPTTTLHFSSLALRSEAARRKDGKLRPDGGS